MIQKHILHRLLSGFYFLPFSVLFLWLFHYSYRAKELLICWLFFSSLFAVLVLIVLGIVLAGYAGQHLVNWVRVAKVALPELAVCLAELLQEASPSPRILVGETLKLLPIPCGPEDSLEIVPSAAEGVRN